MTEKDTQVSRRRFNGLAGLVGAGAFGATLSPWAAKEMDAKAVGLTGQAISNEEMDAYHEAGVKAFPAETEGYGTQDLEYEMDGDVKVFNITCEVVDWEFDVGKFVEAWTYNGVTPGPTIRITAGDTIRVNVTNNLPESTAIHWHGLIIPNDQDGVPYLTQPPIKPGETYTYEFTVPEHNYGSHMYHSHHNAAKQVTMGLLGAFIVEPPETAERPEEAAKPYDHEYICILNDGPIGGYSINGKGFPSTQPVVVNKGDRLLVRYMNEGLMIHPMHLHGMPQLVISQDGWDLPVPYMCDTLNIAPGQRFDVIVECTEPGLWAFHCHILSHAESDHGMFGMVTVLIVNDEG